MRAPEASPLAILLRLAALMRPHAGWMALAILLSAIATAAHVALMALSGWFITAMALAGLAGVSMNYFTPAALIRGLSILRTGGRYGERVLGHEATLQFVAGLRTWLFARIERAAPANLGDIRAADLLTRLRADIDRLELAFLRVLSPVLAGLVVVVPVLLWLALTMPAIAVLVSIMLLASALVVPALLIQANQNAASALVSGTPRLNAALLEAIEGQAELAIYDPAGLHRQHILDLSEALLGEEDRLARAQALGAMAIPLGAHLAMLGTLLLGVPAVGAATLAPADLPMLALLSVALFDAVAGWPLAAQTLPVLVQSARRVFDLADRHPLVPEPDTPKPLDGPVSLALTGISFRYPEAPSPVLTSLSLALEPGRRVAILGPSGAGKSSLAALIMRFYEPNEGSITANGEPYAAYGSEALRRRIALLSQNDHLFSGSVRDNLLLANPMATLPELEAACRTAQILPLIESLPEGFDTFVGAHGRALSGGEARRLLLARTLLRRPDILILDEPTEGLDPDTEQAVIDALLADHADAALLMLTHKAIGLDRMDAVFTLEAGQLVATAHAPLLSPAPPYIMKS